MQKDTNKSFQLGYRLPFDMVTVLLLSLQAESRVFM